MPDPIDIERARSLVLARARPVESEPVALAAALDRVAADDVRAPWPVPSFDNSAMDGYAVRAADTAGASRDRPVALSIVGESRAGAPAQGRVGERQAARISTGAMLPAGADAVVRVEDTLTPAGHDDGRMRVLVAVDPSHDVRRAGEDVEQGERAIAKGTTLGAAELGMLASLGFAAVACMRRPRVALLTTGDELLEPDDVQRPGGVRNSNAYAIQALVERAGGEVAHRQVVPDEALATRRAIEAALAYDALIVCGGVSVGEHDHVRAGLKQAGAQEIFWRLALRPGSPAWFGLGPQGSLAFALPGNPVSAMVTFLLLARPALRAMLGAPVDADRTTAIFDEPYAKPAGRAHAVRCRLRLGADGWHARPTGPQGSHILTSMLGADALALIPADSDGVQAGERVLVELLERR